MDVKLERYYNYVVEDLVKNTKIDYVNEIITFPFFYHYSLFFPSLYHLKAFANFSKYLYDTYGIKEEETKIIKGMYEERILSLIKK